MSFAIVHELSGCFSDGVSVARGRMRCRCNRSISLEMATAIADALDAVDGVLGVSVNPVIGSVLLFYSDDKARATALSVLVEAGKLIDAGQGLAGPADRQKPQASGPMAAGMEVLTYFLTRPFIPFRISMVLAIWHAIPVILKGLRDLARMEMRVSVLDGAAISVCLLRRDFRTARTLSLLLGVGETLEAWTRQKSLDSLTESLAITADTVWLRDGSGVERQVLLSEVGEGDVVIVRAGTSIPVDGVVVDGEAVVNQSAMTGEPIGVVRGRGCSVFAGTVVEEGEIAIRVSKVGDSTRLRQIVNFIEESEGLKAGIQGRFERMADMAVPFTFGLAALVWLVTRDPIRASSVLLVDYSCALKLTTPLAVLAAMREGALNGVVVKGGRYLEALSDVDTVVFDKTGTLTNATPEVAAVVAVNGFEAGEVLRLMACLEEHFPHPVARAVVRAAEAHSLSHPEVHDEVQYIVAHGVCSLVRGQKVVVGSRHYVEQDEGVNLSALRDATLRETALGRSLLFVAIGGVAAGLIAIEDPPRPEARDAIRNLEAYGIHRVLMITGDDRRTAKAIAEQLGISEYRAQVLPADKADVVRQLTEEGCHVLMVGDGINDAPALSSASVGVALCDGTDLAQGVANVLLTTPTLHCIATAKVLGASALKRIHTNFFYTMLFNSAFLAGGIFSILSPATSALLHNMTTFALALRSMRPMLPREDTTPQDESAPAPVDAGAA